MTEPNPIAGRNQGDENALADTTILDGLPLDPRQALAYDEWQRLCADGTPPLQRDFRPDRITRALPAAMLLHVERDGASIRLHQKLEGRVAALAFGESTGGDIEDIYADSHLDEILPRYLETAMTGDAAMTRCAAPTRGGDAFEFTRLILPFRDPEGVVNRLFVVFHFDPVALARLSGPLRVRREKADEFAVAESAFGERVLRTRQAS